MDMNALKQAVTGAATLTAPTGASPNATGANAFAQAAIGNIQNLAASDYQVAGTKAAGGMLEGAVGARADETAANEKAARDAEADRLAAEQKALQEKIDAYSDPKKYQKVINEVGGYDFFDPDGEKISPRDYAKVQNKHITEIYKDSQDTTDQEFIQDYKDIQKIGEIVQSGDKKAYDKYLAKDPDIQKRLKENNITNYADMVKSFRSSYPQYFSSGSAKDVGNASYNDRPLRDTRSVLDKLKARIGMGEPYKGF